jgi:glycosyltransferase involved in cell wall biosynthesis
MEKHFKNILTIQVSSRSGMLKAFAQLFYNFSKHQNVFTNGYLATQIGMVFAYFARIPNRVFVRHHGYLHHRLNKPFHRLFDSFLGMLATKVLTVSKSNCQLMRFEGINEAKISLVPNGFNLDLNSPIGSVLPTNERFNVLVVARNVEWKGIEYALAGFYQFWKSNPRSTLTICGSSGESTAALIEMVELKELDFKKSVIFQGWSLDIPARLRESNALIHVPIGPYDESFGQIYVEGLLSHTSCIFTISGVLHEIPHIEDYAYLVPFENSQRITDALLDVYHNSSQKKKMKINNFFQFGIDLSTLNMSRRYLQSIVIKD